MLVGGHELAVEPTRIGRRIGEAHGDGLADLTLEVGRRAELALEAGARDFERVVTGDRVDFVHLARDQPCRQRQFVHVDAPLGACR